MKRGTSIPYIIFSFYFRYKRALVLVPLVLQFHQVHPFLLSLTQEEGNRIWSMNLVRITFLYQILQMIQMLLEKRSFQRHPKQKLKSLKKGYARFILKGKSGVGMINATKQSYQLLTRILAFLPYFEVPDVCNLPSILII